MQVPGGPGKNFSGPIIDLPKNPGGIRVRVLELVSPGLRKVVWAGKVALIPDHPLFHPGQLATIVWNKDTKAFDPLPANQNIQTDEPQTSPGPISERVDTYNDSLEPVLLDSFDDQPYGVLLQAYDQDFSGDSNSTSDEDQDSVRALLETLRWALPNFQRTGSRKRWIQLPVSLGTQTPDRYRALFLWDGKRIEKACVERQNGDSVMKWWFLTDLQGKWYIVKDGRRSGSSGGIDIYL